MSRQIRAAAVEFVWSKFPTHCMVMTESGIGKFVDLGMQRAGKYGYVASPEVHAYLTLMLFLGSYFDEDPQLPWAVPLLAGKPPMETLFGTALQAVEPVVGPTGEHYRRALLWVRKQSFDSLEHKYGGNPDAALERWLFGLFEEKFRSLQPALLDRVIHDLQTRADQFGLTTRAGLLTLAALEFLLGRGVDRDPVHAWAGPILANTESLAAAKAAALHREALSQLHRLMRLDRYIREN